MNKIHSIITKLFGGITAVQTKAQAVNAAGSLADTAVGFFNEDIPNSIKPDIAYMCIGYVRKATNGEHDFLTGMVEGSSHNISRMLTELSRYNDTFAEALLHSANCVKEDSKTLDYDSQ